MTEDDELRRALAARAGGAQIPLGERARAVATAHPRSGTGVRWRGQARGRGMALGAAAVAVLVVVVAAFGLRSPAPDLAAGPSGSPQPTSTGSPRPAPSPTVAPLEPVEPWGTVTYSAGDDAAFDVKGHNTFVQAAAYWRGRWIAVGYRLDLAERDVVGCIWTSTDGLAWSLDDAWPDVQFDRLVNVEDRLTIVGAHRAPDVGETPGASQATMWTSTNGSDWTEASLPDHDSDYWVVSSAAAGGRGWLVHIVDIEGRENWLTVAPGEGWRDVAMDPAAFEGAQSRDVVGTPDGWMAFGTIGLDAANPGGFGDPSNERGAIWWSADGERWTAAEVERPGTSVATVVPIAGGWLAIGSDHRGCPRCIGHERLLWSSGDGRRWSPVELDQANANGFGGTIIASDGRRGVLFDTDGEGRLRLRETADGIEWADVAVVADPSIGESAILGGGTIAIGPDAILTFVDPSVRSEAYFWMVPRIAVAGPPPSDGATQPPAATPHDVPCEPAGQECGP